jgi:hypothetical protein
MTMTNFHHGLPAPGQRFKLPSGSIVEAFGKITYGNVPCNYVDGQDGGANFAMCFLALPCVEWL